MPRTTWAWRATPRVSPIRPWLPSSTPCGPIPTISGLSNLANACMDQGRAAEAITYYRKALASRPDDAPVHSNLLLAMQYQSGADPGKILAEARPTLVSTRNPWPERSSLTRPGLRPGEAADRLRLSRLPGASRRFLPGADPRRP